MQVLLNLLYVSIQLYNYKRKNPQTTQFGTLCSAVLVMADALQFNALGRRQQL